MFIYGKNVAKERLNSNEKINRAYISNKFRDNEIIDLLKSKNIKISFVEPYILDSKVDGLHQGIVLDVDEIKTYELDEELGDESVQN